MMENNNLERITESRTDLSWCRLAKKVRNLTWFNNRTFTTARLSRVARFLNAAEIEVPLQMPRRTAIRYNVPTNYMSFIRKGRNPATIRCWPWHDDDTLELGRVRKSTDCEDHNGHLLFQAADFRPIIVSYLPLMQAYIGTATYRLAAVRHCAQWNACQKPASLEASVDSRQSCDIDLEVFPLHQLVTA